MPIPLFGPLKGIKDHGSAEYALWMAYMSILGQREVRTDQVSHVVEDIRMLVISFVPCIIGRGTQQSLTMVPLVLNAPSPSANLSGGYHATATHKRDH